MINVMKSIISFIVAPERQSLTLFFAAVQHQVKVHLLNYETWQPEHRPKVPYSLRVKAKVICMCLKENISVFQYFRPSI